MVWRVKMDGFKYEMHLHTSEVSPCARVSAREIPKLYLDKGYDVIVVTDHFAPYFFENRKYQKWEDAVDAYLRGYYIAANEGLKCGIRVLLGMEITFSGSPEDYLVYGIDESFLKKYPHLYRKNIKSFRKIARKHNLFVVQAHPCRHYIKKVAIGYIDGLEAINGRDNLESNEKAGKLADEHKLIKIAGSDFHTLDDLAGAATVMNSLADSSEELAELLFENDVVDIFGGKM